MPDARERLNRPRYYIHPTRSSNQIRSTIRAWTVAVDAVEAEATLPVHMVTTPARPDCRTCYCSSVPEEQPYHDGPRPPQAPPTSNLHTPPRSSGSVDRIVFRTPIVLGPLVWVRFPRGTSPNHPVARVSYAGASWVILAVTRSGVQTPAAALLRTPAAGGSQVGQPGCRPGSRRCGDRFLDGQAVNNAPTRSGNAAGVSCHRRTITYRASLCARGGHNHARTGSETTPRGQCAVRPMVAALPRHDGSVGARCGTRVVSDGAVFGGGVREVPRRREVDVRSATKGCALRCWNRGCGFEGRGRGWSVGRSVGWGDEGRSVGLFGVWSGCAAWATVSNRGLRT